MEETTQTHIIECNRSTSTIDTNATAPAKWSSQCQISLKAGDKISVEAAVVNSTGASSEAAILEFTGENVVIDGEEQDYSDNVVVFELGFYMQNDSTKCLNLPVRLPYAPGANETFKGGAYGGTPTNPYGTSDDPYWFGPNQNNLHGTNTDANTYRLRQRQNPSLNINRSNYDERVRPAYPPTAAAWEDIDETVGIGGLLENASMYPSCGLGFDAKVDGYKVGGTDSAGAYANAYQWIGCITYDAEGDGYLYLPGIAETTAGAVIETQVNVSATPNTLMRSVWRNFDTGYQPDGNPWLNTRYIIIATPLDNLTDANSIL